MSNARQQCPCKKLFPTYEVWNSFLQAERFQARYMNKTTAIFW